MCSCKPILYHTPKIICKFDTSWPPTLYHTPKILRVCKLCCKCLCVHVHLPIAEHNTKHTVTAGLPAEKNRRRFISFSCCLRRVNCCLTTQPLENHPPVIVHTLRHFVCFRPAFQHLSQICPWNIGMLENAKTTELTTAIVARPHQQIYIAISTVCSHWGDPQV